MSGSKEVAVGRHDGTRMAGEAIRLGLDRMDFVDPEAAICACREGRILAE